MRPLLHMAALGGMAVALAACGDTPDPCLGANPPSTCAVVPPATLMLTAEIIPPSKGAEVRQDIARLELDTDGAAVVRMAAARRLAGTVTAGDERPVPAQIIAARPSQIPGRPDVFYQTTTSDTGAYELRLPAGSYTVRVVPMPPADAELPPLVEAIQLNDDLNRGFLLPRSSSQAIAGEMADALGDPLPGVVIRALAADDVTLRSSVPTTDKDGRFSLNLSPDVKPGEELVVKATRPPTDGRQYPVLTRKVTVGQKDRVELRMPALPNPAPISMPIAGQLSSGAMSKVVGARVDFEATVTQPPVGQTAETAAKYSISTVSSEDGLATASLIPGTGGNREYTVDVSPPSDSPFGHKRFKVQVGPTTTGGVLEALMLDPRSLLLGRVLDPSSKPIKGATVAPQPTDGGMPMTAATTLTDGTGAFNLRLDPGGYDVEIVPPSGEKLARWSFARNVEGDIDLGDVMLPVATAAHLTVLDAAGRPAPEVEVRLYVVTVSDKCNGAPAPCYLPARLRGDGFTDANGVVTLLVPAM